MDKRRGMLVVSVTILVLCFVGAASATNWTVNGSGGADFTGIQDAINNASDGDTILVHSGVYYENVVVNKSVTLRGVGHPVMDAAKWSGSAIRLTADGITLVGFNATNSVVVIKVTSNNNTITGNNVSSNAFGIDLSSSSNNTITGNSVSCEGANIRLSSSSNNTITGNNVSSNNGRGIRLYSSSNNNIITGNNVSSNEEGIRLDDSYNNTIKGNVFVNDGLFVKNSYQNTVEENIVNGKPLVYLEDVSDHRVEDAGQVILVNCNNITIENLDLSNTIGGIALWKTENSKISNNTVCHNNRYGGIRLSYSSNNSITGNNVCNNWDGILLYYSSNNNSITGNNVSNNRGDGILLSDSSNNAITGNVFVNDGLSVYSSYQNTVEENTVNAKPLVYLEDVSDYKVEDAGQVIIVNCNNITIENLDLSNTSGGVGLLKTRNSKISNNTVCNNNGGGIRLYYSSNNSITGNNVCNNREGIILSSSCNNNITGNNVSNNNGPGIRLSDFSNNNIITGSNVSKNYYGGIHLTRSSNNKIYFNNFIDNSGYIPSIKSTNIWNSPLEIAYTYDGTTYESYLGNYWDDYEGTDGDGDGIGDTHYRIYSERGDDYPLMKPFENYIT